MDSLHRLANWLDPLAVWLNPPANKNIPPTDKPVRQRIKPVNFVPILSLNLPLELGIWPFLLVLSCQKKIITPF